MTLPEIQKEEKEQPKITCKFCGKEGASKAHERFCSKNPNNPRSKKKAAMKQEPILETPTISPTQTPAEPIIISDVQPYIGDIAAWFNDETGMFSRPIQYIGIVNNIPNVLVLLENGSLVPPYTVSGFVGMFPNDMKFTSDTNDDEPFPPFPMEEEEVKPVVIPETKVLPQVIKTAEKPIKKHWWSRTPNPKIPPADKTELKTLVEGAINATGRTN